MLLLPEKVKKIDVGFLTALHAYLVVHPNVILRELKKEFANVDNFSDKLDQFIAYGLIVRRERRYLTAIVEWPALDVKNLLAEIAAQLQDLIVSKNITLADCFLSLQGPARHQALAIADADYQALHPYVVEKIELKSRYGVTSYQNQGAQTTLVNYFADATQTATLTALYDLVGDVTPSYFLDQALPKLFRARHKPLRESRYDIFTDALKALHFLDADGQTIVSLATSAPQPQKNAPLSELFNAYMQELTLTYEPAVVEFLGEILRGLILARLGDMGYFLGRATDGPAWSVQYLYKIN